MRHLTCILTSDFPTCRGSGGVVEEAGGEVDGAEGLDGPFLHPTFIPGGIRFLSLK